MKRPVTNVSESRPNAVKQPESKFIDKGMKIGDPFKSKNQIENSNPYNNQNSNKLNVQTEMRRPMSQGISPITKNGSQQKYSEKELEEARASLRLLKQKQIELKNTSNKNNFKVQNFDEDNQIKGRTVQNQAFNNIPQSKTGLKLQNQKDPIYTDIKRTEKLGNKLNGEIAVKRNLQEDFEDIPIKVGNKGGMNKNIDQNFDDLPIKGGNKLGIKKTYNENSDDMPIKGGNKVVMNKNINQDFDDMPIKSGNKVGINKNINRDFDDMPVKGGNKVGINKNINQNHNFDDIPIKNVGKTSSINKMNQHSNNNEEHNFLNKAKIKVPEVEPTKNLKNRKNQQTNQNGQNGKVEIVDSNQYKNFNIEEIEDERPAFAPKAKNFEELVKEQLEQQNEEEEEEDEGAENEDEDGRVPCSGCGRKFNPESINKHKKVCKKVFKTKRKAFNMKEQRIVNDEHKELLINNELMEKKNKAKIEEKKKREKEIEIAKSNWKKKSEELRNIAKAQDTNGLNKMPEILVPGMKPSLNSGTDNYQTKSGLDHCGLCQRSYNSEAFKKHLPTCERKHKEMMMKNKTNLQNNKFKK